MTTSSPGRVRRWARAAVINTALALGSLLLALLLAEFAVRLVAPQQLILIRPDLWQPADTVGWLRRPGVDVRINTGEGWVDVKTDRDGFRVGEAGRVEAGLPVLVLGDSFMEALQVDYEESFPGLLQQSLPAATGTQVAVRNAGVGAWEPGQYLLHARQLLPREDYELVITAIFLGNDVVSERRGYWPQRAPVERNRFRIPRSLDRRELVNATLAPLNDALEVRSHLFVLFRNNLKTLRMKLGLHPLAFPPEFLKVEAETDRWDVTADIARDIDALAAREGAQTLILLIPAAFQIDPDRFASYVSGYGLDPDSVDLEQPNRLMLEALSERGLLVLDALPAFRAAHEAGHDLYGTVDPHLSRSGHDVLAELVTPVAARLLMTGPSEEVSR